MMSMTTLWEVIAIDTENATVEVAWSASVEFRTLDELDVVFFASFIYVDDFTKWPYCNMNELTLQMK